MPQQPEGSTARERPKAWLPSPRPSRRLAPSPARCSAPAASRAPRRGRSRVEIEAPASHSWTSWTCGSSRPPRPAVLGAVMIRVIDGSRPTRGCRPRRFGRGRRRSRQRPLELLRKPWTCNGLPLGRKGASQGRIPKPIKTRGRGGPAEPAIVVAWKARPAPRRRTASRSAGESRARISGSASPRRGAPSRAAGRPDSIGAWTRPTALPAPSRTPRWRDAGPSRAGRQRLQGRDRMVAQRPGGTAVIEFEELRPEGRSDVDLDRALPGQDLQARQPDIASWDLVREVVVATAQARS